jgi:hypothetical protein
MNHDIAVAEKEKREELLRAKKDKMNAQRGTK